MLLLSPASFNASFHIVLICKAKSFNNIASFDTVPLLMLPSLLMIELQALIMFLTHSSILAFIFPNNPLSLLASSLIEFASVSINSHPLATSSFRATSSVTSSPRVFLSEFISSAISSSMFMPVDFVNASNKMNVSKANAGRLVMTESAYFSSAAQKECFKELDVERYEIVATLDGHTSDICQEMDGKVFKMSEYEEGVTAPPFHVNCRSCTAPYFDDEFTKGERIARNEDGDTYYVPADMTYGEWRNKYIDLKNDSEYQDKINERRAKVGVKNLEKLHSSDIMKSKVTSGALTDNNDPLYEKRNRHANSYYDSIRNSKKNNIVNTIASNTGMAESDISKIYDHVFINEYELYGGKRRFDPDYDMAESFRRLREGKEIQEHDLILLSHERLEYELMNKEGMTYQEAHSIAEAKYNYRKALDEFKHKNGLL
ncbi:MAG: hypothetical protein EGR36_00540 [Eubacterium ventriosum]|nr:hypothetical protein [Eubacterium ventriosum]